MWRIAVARRPEQPAEEAQQRAVAECAASRCAEALAGSPAADAAVSRCAEALAGSQAASECVVSRCAEALADPLREPEAPAVPVLRVGARPAELLVAAAWATSPVAAALLESLEQRGTPRAEISRRRDEISTAGAQWELVLVLAARRRLARLQAFPLGLHWLPCQLAVPLCEIQRRQTTLSTVGVPPTRGARHRSVGS